MDQHVKNGNLFKHMPPRILSSRVLRGCWAKGYHARYRGEELVKCPYTTHHQEEWKAGWSFADAEILIKKHQV
jgi:ribosome modulation factor